MQSESVEKLPSAQSAHPQPSWISHPQPSWISHPQPSWIRSTLKISQNLREPETDQRAANHHEIENVPEAVEVRARMEEETKVNHLQ